MHTSLAFLLYQFLSIFKSVFLTEILGVDINDLVLTIGAGVHLVIGTHTTAVTRNPPHFLVGFTTREPRLQ